MNISLHHTHFATNDVQSFCEFFIENFDAEIVYDAFIGGDRNIFLKIGSGRMHLFESRKPPQVNKSSFHHIGIMVDDLQKMVRRLKEKNIYVSKISEVNGGSFAVTKGPDRLKIELFEVSDKEFKKYFVDL